MHIILDKYGESKLKKTQMVVYLKKKKYFYQSTSLFTEIALPSGKRLRWLRLHGKFTSLCLDLFEMSQIVRKVDLS